ncbi:MAG: hypothetical protein EXR69_00760 [Myxococcales bacterium]|nr:hypothetical protein [Myxococcales bacterium]
MPVDLYAALGVPKTADQAEIKRAFRSLAQKLHPDRNKEPTAEKRFKEVAAAHEVLGDEQRRALYDEFGEESLRSGFDAEQARVWKARGGMPHRAGGGFGGGVDIDDILRGFGGGGFGGGGFGGGPRRPARGADIEGDVHVPLLDALRGKALPVSILRPANCKVCEGKGGTGAKTCAPCKGSGRRQVRGLGGTMATACNDCAGSGKVFEVECAVCGSTGRVRERQTVQVSLPVGIADGKVIRLRGQGAEGQDRAPAGDLLLTVHITEHPFVRRRDQDLEMDLPVSLAEAIGGGPVDIPMPMGGKIRFPLPAGSGNGQRLRVRGKGVDGGDLYLIVRPVLPKVDDAALPEALALAKKLDAGRDAREGWEL